MQGLTAPALPSSRLLRHLYLTRLRASFQQLAQRMLLDYPVPGSAAAGPAATEGVEAPAAAGPAATAASAARGDSAGVTLAQATPAAARAPTPKAVRPRPPANRTPGGSRRSGGAAPGMEEAAAEGGTAGSAALAGREGLQQGQAQAEYRGGDVNKLLVAALKVKLAATLASSVAAARQQGDGEEVDLEAQEHTGVFGGDGQAAAGE